MAAQNLQTLLHQTARRPGGEELAAEMILRADPEQLDMEQTLRMAINLDMPKLFEAVIRLWGLEPDGDPVEWAWPLIARRGSWKVAEQMIRSGYDADMTPAVWARMPLELGRVIVVQRPDDLLGIAITAAKVDRYDLAQLAIDNYSGSPWAVELLIRDIAPKNMAFVETVLLDQVPIAFESVRRLMLSSIADDNKAHIARLLQARGHDLRWLTMVTAGNGPQLLDAAFGPQYGEPAMIKAVAMRDLETQRELKRLGVEIAEPVPKWHM